jgi:hypothetical protein
VGAAFTHSKGWPMLGPGHRAGLASLSLSADARSAITHDLDSGYIVVAPTTAVPQGGEPSVGWWRINPTTGDLLGVADSGWGQSVTERATLTEMAVAFAKGFDFQFALCQFGPQMMNMARILDDRVFNGWHPSWTQAAAKGKNPGKLANENFNGCLLEAIVAGAAATLPLLLITLRAVSGRVALIAAEEELQFAKTELDVYAKTEPGVDPFAKTGIDPLAKTGIDPFGKTEVPNVSPIPNALPPPTLPAPAAGETGAEQAVRNLRQARDQYFKALDESAQAAQKYIQYRAETLPSRGGQGFDPATDQANHDQWVQKHTARIEAMRNLEVARMQVEQPIKPRP